MVCIFRYTEICMRSIIDVWKYIILLKRICCCLFFLWSYTPFQLIFSLPVLPFSWCECSAPYRSLQGTLCRYAKYPEQLCCAVFCIPVPLHTSTARRTIIASKKAIELGERMIKKKSRIGRKKNLKKAPESGVRIIRPRQYVKLQFLDVWEIQYPTFN